MVFRKKLVILPLIILLTAVVFSFSPTFASLDYDANWPTCTISFNRIGPQVTATILATSTNGEIISLLQDGDVPTSVSAMPAASVTSTWTYSANTNFTATVRNSVSGNRADCTITYSSAWIKTSGDVHSNTNINTPGGP